MSRIALAVLIGGGGLALTMPAHGERRTLAMLDQLDTGAWDLRQHGAAAAMGTLCLDSGRKLIQLKHPGLACNSVIVEDQPNEVTVQYTCRGHGYGRTQVRRETNSLVQIDTQGIVDGRPFAFAAEGRRVGTCHG